MTSFIDEQVKLLDLSLTSSFKTHETKFALQAATPTTTDSPSEQPFVLKATQALDLLNAPPSIEKVQEYLEQFRVSTESADPALEWLFVSKCTIAAYGQVFSEVLNMTLPVSKAIDYWNQVHGSPLQEIYYTLETIPSRLFSLVKNTSHHYQNQQDQNKFISLVTSTDYLIRQIFPIHSLIASNNNASVNTNRKRRIVPAWFSLSRTPFFFQMIRDEVRLKKKTLQKFRTQQAARLGLLLMSPPQFCRPQQDDNEDSPIYFQSVVAMETAKCLYSIQSALDPLMQDPTSSDPSATLGVFKIPPPSIEATDPRQVASELVQLIDTWKSTYSKNLSTIGTVYGPPSGITRYWVPAILTYVVGKYVVRYGFKRKEDIAHYINEFGKTAYDFAVNWIYEPVMKVWDTIRLKDQRLGVLSKEGLKSDLDSLERMVIGFAKDHQHLSDQELQMLALKIREGDISPVLKEYEKAIKSPLKNVVAGDLIQTMLIQVQKTKVDVDLAMSALDKLLKSNELNFAFLAVAPSMLLTWASASWFKNTVQGRSQQKMKQTGLPMRETLRRIERQLILNQTNSNEMGEWSVNSNDDANVLKKRQQQCETQGILLCETHLLRSLAKCIPVRDSMRDRFIEDLRDLENPQLTNQQKIQTIDRMTRFWGFL